MKSPPSFSIFCLGCILALLPIDKSNGKEAAQNVPALTLTKEGVSEYVIVHAENAPQSVRLAANELQRLLEVATSVRILIQTEASSKMICLGDHPATRDAGIDVSKLPLESFRIFTKDENLYIAGRDTLEEENVKPRYSQHDNFGVGESRGTLFGVITFLQDTVGVRWLMPGSIGEDVPELRKTLGIPKQDRTGGPFFLARTMHLGHMKEESTRKWIQNMRMGGSIATEAGHSFDDLPGMEVLKAHPEFMPMQENGTRLPISAAERKPGVYPSSKYCLTNPGLIDAFAKVISEEFSKNPNTQCMSISPSDGGGWSGNATWCHDSECQKYVYRKTDGTFGDFGGRGYSVTPMVLHFYNEVAKKIAQDFPDRFVGGYVYYDYVYPSDDNMAIEPNVFLELATNSGYGYKFYQQHRAEEFKKLTAAWAKKTSNLGWTDYSTWMRDAIGAPLPPGLEIMDLVFQSLAENHFKKIAYIGTEAWGYGAVTNYLGAQLMWNPKLDLQATYEDFMVRCYGGAAPQIKAIYDLVEERLKGYIRSKNYPDHELWYDSVAYIYKPIFNDIEKLFIEAQKQKLSEKQQARLDMFRDNLLMLHFNMRHAGLVTNAEKSSLYLNDLDYQTFLRSKIGSISVVDLKKWIDGQERYGRVQTQLWGPDHRALNAKTIPVSEKPTLDGDLSDPVWKQAEEAGEFRLLGSRNLTQMPVKVKMLRDDTFLYVAVESTEKQNSELLHNDRIELLLANRGKYPGSYWKLAINPENTIQQSFGGAKGIGDLNAVSAVKTTPESWVLECAIPLASLGVSDLDEKITLKANIGRIRAQYPLESSFWCSVEERFESPLAFGNVVLKNTAEPAASP